MNKIGDKVIITANGREYRDIKGKTGVIKCNGNSKSSWYVQVANIVVHIGNKGLKPV